ncbi:hypothetical protein PG988_003279 [Apiospora saccharicola]
MESKDQSSETLQSSQLQSEVLRHEHKSRSGVTWRDWIPRQTRRFGRKRLQGKEAYDNQRPTRYAQRVQAYGAITWECLRDEILSNKWPEEDFSGEPSRDKEDCWLLETPGDSTEEDRRAMRRLGNSKFLRRPPSPDDSEIGLEPSASSPVGAPPKAFNITGIPVESSIGPVENVTQWPPSTGVENEGNSPTSSDVESIFSFVTESQFSLSDLSSVAEASVPEGENSAIVLLIDLLYRDEALYNLDLKQEASGEAQSKASAFLRASARHVARVITEAVSGKPEDFLPQVPTEDHKARTEAWLRKQKGLQQISQLGVLDETEEFPDLGELDDNEARMSYQSLNGLMKFLRSSAAFDHLERKLRDIGNGVELTGDKHFVQIAPSSVTPDLEAAEELSLLYSVEESTPEGPRQGKPLLFASAWQAPLCLSTLWSKQHHNKNCQPFNDKKAFDDIAKTALITALRLTPEISRQEYGAIHGSRSAVWRERNVDWRFDFMAYGLNPLMMLSPEKYGSSSCWTQLFDPGMVVWHPIQRPWGEGLGMSFELLCHLTAARDYLWVSDRGESHEIGASEATSKAQDDDKVDDEGIIYHSNLQTTKGRWLKINDLAGIRHTKAFLGWCKDAEILLWTDQLNNKLGWSDTLQKSKTLRLTGMSAGVSGGLAAAVTSPLTLSTNVGATMTFVNTTQHFKAPKKYAEALLGESRKSALIIDHSAKRAFLVPKLSLALHLCRIVALEAYQPPDVEDFPTASPSIDGSRAAHSVFEQNKDKIVIGKDGWGNALTLEELFLRVNKAMSSSANDSEPPRRLTLHGPMVPAREARGCMDEPDGGTGLSMVQDWGLLPWVRIAELADLRFVCSNLGSAIRPAMPVGHIGCECCDIPCGRYLLGAHLWCLERLLYKLGPDSALNGLCQTGMLDFGNGHIMRWKGHRDWKVKHRRDFWETNILEQFVWDEKDFFGKARRFLGTDDREVKVWQRSPGISGAFIFGNGH